MSYFYELIAVVLAAIASINAAEGDPEGSVWMAGCAIAFATLGLVREHRVERNSR